MTWSEFFDLYGDPLFQATKTTLTLALSSFAMAMVVGVILVSFRVSPVRPLVLVAQGFVAVFRNTPLLVVFFLAVFGLGNIGIVFDYYRAALLALGCYTGAYLSEVLRSGINAVPRGQAEAGRAIGLGFVQLLRLIVIPQAVRTVIAPIGNMFVANFKNTSVAATISVFELTAQSSRMFNNAAAGSFRVLFVISAIYVIFLIPSSWVFRGLEHRYAIKR